MVLVLVLALVLVLRQVFLGLEVFLGLVHDYGFSQPELASHQLQWLEGSPVLSLKELSQRLILEGIAAVVVVEAFVQEVLVVELALEAERVVEEVGHEKMR